MWPSPPPPGEARACMEVTVEERVYQGLATVWIVRNRAGERSQRLPAKRRPRRPRPVRRNGQGLGRLGPPPRRRDGRRSPFTGHHAPRRGNPGRMTREYGHILAPIPADVGGAGHVLPRAAGPRAGHQLRPRRRVRRPGEGAQRHRAHSHRRVREKLPRGRHAALPPHLLADPSGSPSPPPPSASSSPTPSPTTLRSSQIRRGWRNLLLAAVAIPFWTSFVVRTSAWKLILGSGGPIDVLVKRGRRRLRLALHPRRRPDRPRLR